MENNAARKHKAAPSGAEKPEKRYPRVRNALSGSKRGRKCCRWDQAQANCLSLEEKDTDNQFGHIRKKVKIALLEICDRVRGLIVLEHPAVKKQEEQPIGTATLHNDKVVKVCPSILT